LAELGRAALELLLDQLKPGATPRIEVLPSELVLRESCGCQALRDSTMRKTEAPPSSSEGLRALAAGADRNIAAIRGLGVLGAAQSAWPESLYVAFVADLGGEKRFVSELREVLHTVARRYKDVGAFHKVITLLWQRVRQTLLPGSEGWRRADSLLHTARVITSGMAERLPTSRRVRFEDFAYKLIGMGNRLGMTVDFPSVSKLMARDLPGYGMSACWICLYEPDAGGARARLVAGFREQEPPSLPDAGIAFDSKMLLPTGFFSDAPEHIIGPLSREGDSPGYVVFARGANEGFVYELLMSQFGSAVQRLELLGRLVLEAEKREAAERERMEKELRIARQIQSGIMPRGIAVEGLQVSALMLPATEVGGDYYDVIRTATGCWIGIGDVAGHGLPTGLVMLMLQSVVSGLIRWHPDAAPKDLLCVVNRVLFENIRQRMAQDEFVTLTLLRYETSGLLRFAGAHEDILIYRAATGRAEWIPTLGTWVGAVPDISEATVDATLQLAPGDVMVLYTDGVLESRNQARETFGPERLAEHLERVANEPVESIRDGLLAAVQAWLVEQDDDFTLFVARYTGVS
jgi:serine phosphatase RsbU (regulator of sigma subunit)